MKRILALVLLLVLSLSVLASCKKKNAKFDLVSTADPTYDYYHNDLSTYITASRADYTGLTVSLDVTEKEVDDYLNDHLLPSYRTPNLITDAAVQDGDTVYIWYTGYIDDVAFEGGSNADEDRPTGLVIGSGSFVDTFETQLIGVIPENTSWENPKVVNVTFPDNYRKTDLAGKAARFDVVVAGVFDGTYTVPELTPEFASSLHADDRRSRRRIPSCAEGLAARAGGGGPRVAQIQLPDRETLLHADLYGLGPPGQRRA